MEMQTAKQRPKNGSLILVPHRDTVRLLEVYIKRSLSLNDGALTNKRAKKKEKWVTKKLRRHSSTPSLHLAEGVNHRVPSVCSVAEPQPKTRPEDSEKPPKKTKKSKKQSFWKNILSFFSSKSEDRDEDAPSEMPRDPGAEAVSDAAGTCRPATPVTSQRKKSMRRKSIKRRLTRKHRSLLKPNKPDNELNAADFTAVISVEPTYSYYEKVSEELEKIVHEVKEKEEVQPLTDEEVINRIIALTKEQGDAIDDKMRDNPTLSSFFQQMTYSSFQKLADAYLEKEALPSHSPPTVLQTAPELVKLAFTLDFTARIAGLSRQNIGHITGLGNCYLKDRFEYQQACTDHPWSDSDD